MFIGGIYHSQMGGLWHVFYPHYSVWSGNNGRQFRQGHDSTSKQRDVAVDIPGERLSLREISHFCIQMGGEMVYTLW